MTMTTTMKSKIKPIVGTHLPRNNHKPILPDGSVETEDSLVANTRNCKRNSNNCSLDCNDGNENLRLISNSTNNKQVVTRIMTTTRKRSFCPQSSTIGTTRVGPDPKPTKDEIQTSIYCRSATPWPIVARTTTTTATKAGTGTRNFRTKQQRLFFIQYVSSSSSSARPRTQQQPVGFGWIRASSRHFQTHDESA